jgi:hypothetical protein
MFFFLISARVVEGDWLRHLTNYRSECRNSVCHRSQCQCDIYFLFNISQFMYCHCVISSGICLIISNEVFYKVESDRRSTEMPDRQGTKVDQGQY